MDLFANILDNDEKIIKTYKPNKRRYVTIMAIFSSLIVLIIFLFVALIIALPSIVAINRISDDTGTKANHGFFNSVFLPMILSFCAVFILFVTFISVYVNVRYKKTYYALTNKHILIRTGFIGADYKKLEISTIQSVDIEVNFIDKFVKPNTGSIRFSSPSVPSVNLMHRRGFYKQGFVFEGVENAYVTFREIKNAINEVKGQVSNH